MSTGIRVCSRCITSATAIRRGVRRIQRQQAGADRPVGRIDDENLEEIGGELLAGAQEIDHLADRPMLGHRDRVAAHQPAGDSSG